MDLNNIEKQELDNDLKGVLTDNWFSEGDPLQGWNVYSNEELNYIRKNLIGLGFKKHELYWKSKLNGEQDFTTILWINPKEYTIDDLITKTGMFDYEDWEIYDKTLHRNINTESEEPKSEEEDKDYEIIFETDDELLKVNPFNLVDFILKNKRTPYYDEFKANRIIFAKKLK